MFICGAASFAVAGDIKDLSSFAPATEALKLETNNSVTARILFMDPFLSKIAETRLVL